MVLHPTLMTNDYPYAMLSPMDTFKNILKWGMWSAIFVIPFIPLYVANTMFFPYISGKNFLFRILVEIALGLWVALAIVDKQYRPKRSWLLASFFIFTVVIAIADFFGVNQIKSIWSNYERMEGLVTILHLLAFFTVLCSALSEKMWRYLTWTSFGAASIVGFIALGQIGKAGGRVDATLGNSTYLGGYMLVHIFLILYFILRRIHHGIKKQEEKWIVTGYYILVLFFTLVMYFTGTRGSLLGFLGGVIATAIILAILEKGHKGLRNISIGILAFAIILVGFLASVRGTEFAKSRPIIDRYSAIATLDLKSYAESAGFARFTLWEMSWQGVKERPLLGWGQDNFPYVFAKYYNPKMYAQEQWFDRTHNVFFDWLIAGGFLGLISYLSIFGVALWLLWKRKEFEVWEKAVFTGLITAYFIHNFFVFDNLTSYILIAIVLSYIHIKSAEDIPPFANAKMDMEKLTAYSYIPLILIPIMIWGINANGYMANKALLGTLMDAQNPKATPDYVIAEFKNTISYNSFGNKEAREQILSTAPRFMTQKVSQEKRVEWYNFTVDEAQKQFAQDNDPRTLIILGGFYASLGSYDNAIKTLEEADKLFPNKPTLLVTISRIYSANKNDLKAKEILNRVIEMVPEYGEAKAALAEILVKEGDLKSAKELLMNNATSTYPSVSENIMTAFANNGDWNFVADMFKVRILTMGSNLTYENNASLVVAYMKAGRKDEALAELETIKGRFPDKATTTDVQIQTLKSGGDFTR
jgi:O-antigen ligase/tetratricopeptide (TPR) repeat protein